MWVQVGSYTCRLNADTKRDGVQKYLKIVDRHAPDAQWHVRMNQNGTNYNKIHFGHDVECIPGFYLYVVPALEAPTTIG